MTRDRNRFDEPAGVRNWAVVAQQETTRRQTCGNRRTSFNQSEGSKYEPPDERNIPSGAGRLEQFRVQTVADRRYRHFRNVRHHICQQDGGFWE